VRIPYSLFLIALISGMADGQGRPGVFFREDWKETSAEAPVSQAHVANPELILRLYGPSRSVIKKSHHDRPADDPFNVWSGLCPLNWAVTLKHRDAYVDLTGQAKVRWRSKQAGFRELRIILKLAGGAWLVSDASEPASGDWRIREFNIPDIRWRKRLPVFLKQRSSLYSWKTLTICPERVSAEFLTTIPILPEVKT